MYGSMRREWAFRGMVPGAMVLGRGRAEEMLERSAGLPVWGLVPFREGLTCWKVHELPKRQNPYEC
jgi:hypothetical protein